MSRAREEYRYEKLTWPEINDAVELGKVCILPCGAVEQHGRKPWSGEQQRERLHRPIHSQKRRSGQAALVQREAPLQGADGEDGCFEIPVASRFHLWHATYCGSQLADHETSAES